jgi:hypothetical protein
MGLTLKSLLSKGRQTRRGVARQCAICYGANSLEEWPGGQGRLPRGGRVAGSMGGQQAFRAWGWQEQMLG